jgi:hypothetical protein
MEIFRNHISLQVFNTFTVTSKVSAMNKSNFNVLDVIVFVNDIGHAVYIDPAYVHILRWGSSMSERWT